MRDFYCYYKNSLGRVMRPKLHEGIKIDLKIATLRFCIKA